VGKRRKRLTMAKYAKKYAKVREAFLARNKRFLLLKKSQLGH
jgi:hypothetical protein